MENSMITAQTVVNEIYGCVPVLVESFIRRYERSGDCIFTRLQSEAMELILEKGCLPMHSIAEQMNMSKQQLTRFIDTLVKKGALTRYNRDSDRRTIYIELTEEGRRLLQEHRRLSRRAHIEKVESLTASEQEELLEAARRFHSLLEKHWGEEE